MVNENVLQTPLLEQDEMIPDANQEGNENNNDEVRGDVSSNDVLDNGQVNRDVQMNKKGDEKGLKISKTEQRLELSKKYSPFGQLDPLQVLQLNLGRQYQMHKLAARYYGYHHFWTLFIPSILLTMISGILAFLSTADTGGLPLSSDTQSLFATLVGCLALVSVFIQSLIKELDLNHRSKLHESVAVDLRELHDNLSFDELEFRTLGHASVSGAGTGSNDNGRDVDSLGAIVKIYEEKFNQVMVGAKSSLPSEILNAYSLVSSRVSLLTFPPVKISEVDKSWKTRVDWVSAISIIHHELFNSISSFHFWPMLMPKADKMIDRTIKVLIDLLRADQGGASKYDEEDGINVYQLLLRQQQSIRDTNRKFMSCGMDEQERSSLS